VAPKWIHYVHVEIRKITRSLGRRVYDGHLYDVLPPKFGAKSTRYANVCSQGLDKCSNSCATAHSFIVVFVHVG